MELQHHVQRGKLGEVSLKALSTPGHTNSCMSYLCGNKVFTGDSLMIRSAGRTDFQQGSAENLYESITQKLFSLPDQTQVFPGHDYKGFTSSTIAAEKQHNPRIGLKNTKGDFVKIMTELKLAYPKKIQTALPANLACGNLPVGAIEGKNRGTKNADGIAELSVEEVFRSLSAEGKSKFMIVDVRRPDEFNNELGHIEGARLLTLGEELNAFLQKADKMAPIIFVCRSGARSGKSTSEAQSAGFKFVYNMSGGMLAWNDRKLPVVRV